MSKAEVGAESREKLEKEALLNSQQQYGPRRSSKAQEMSLPLS
jgi:hypothetical protein